MGARPNRGHRLPRDGAGAGAFDDLAGGGELASLNEFPALSAPSWWLEPGRRALTCAVVLGTFALWLLLSKLPLGVPGRVAARAVVGAAIWLLRAAGFVLLALTVTDAFERLELDDGTATEQMTSAVLFIALGIGGIVMQWVSGRTSLHRLNRDRISTCFAVLRNGGDIRPLPSAEPLLSDLEPPCPGTERSFPRLLICAAANVIWHFPGGTRRTFAPFVFSHDACGIPGLRSALLPTRRLEASRTPAGWPIGSDEPLLPLMSAVACTGAALSPSMGKRTVPALRPLIALMNVRLGRWIHNPMSFRVREDAARAGDGTMPGRVSFSGGYDEFLPELLGMHRADAVSLYISGGGHYDNTGLIALLMGRCEVIWCVDSEADRHGEAGQLREVIAFAYEELGITIDLNLERFHASSGGLLGDTHAVGTITYPEGSGTLVVIKLGLTSGSPQELHNYRREDDPRFPRHGTFTSVAFGQKRMDAYRRLGVANARAAMEDSSCPGPG